MSLIKKALLKDKLNKVSEKASVQIDWEQNNSNANDYIKNRPFYEEDYIVTFNNIEINFNPDEQSFKWVSGSLPTANFDKTKEYKIIFDGQEYYSKIKSGYAKAVGSYLYLGEALPWDSRFNEEYPFCIYCPNPKAINENVSEIGFTVNPIKNETINCFVAIIDPTEKVVAKIDPKFIPNIQIVPINENSDMTVNDFLDLKSGFYYIYDSPLANAYGLIYIIDDGYSIMWVCYDTGMLFEGVYVDENILNAEESYDMYGVGYNALKDALDNGKSGENYMLSLDDNMEAIFTKFIPPECITHINTDGTMTSEEFKNLNTGIYIFDNPLSITGYNDTAIIRGIVCYEQEGNDFKAHCLNGLLEITRYYDTFYIGTMLPIATSTNFGAVKPVKKTDEMTQEVGIGSVGELYTAPPDYIINSSTEGSTKKFQITVDDDGVVSATEVTE